MAGWQHQTVSDPHSSGDDPAAPVAATTQGRLRVVAVSGSSPPGGMFAGVVAELARRDNMVIICGQAMLVGASESTCLVGRLHTAMPRRATAVVPIRPCPTVGSADVALIEQLHQMRIVVVAMVTEPAADLVSIAEHLYGRLGADELALAEESGAGLVMQRLPRPHSAPA